MKAKKLDIVFTQRFSFGGGLIVTHYLADWLARFGHNVVCLFLRTRFLGASSFKTQGASYKSIWLDVFPAIYPLGLKKFLDKYFTKNKTDVLISTGAEGAYLQRVCDKNSVLHISSYHHPNPTEVNLKNLFAPKYLNPKNFGRWLHKNDIRLEGLALKKAEFIHCVSRDLKQKVHQIFNIPSQKIFVVYNGVDIKKFSPQEKNKSKRIFFSGGLIGHKGIDTFFMALPKVIQKHSDLEADIIGLGDWNVYRKKASDLGILEKIKYHGYVSYKDIEKYYQRASIFASPTKHEGFSLAILEAMACGLPVVATNVSSIPEIIKHGVNGLLIPFNDPDALADAFLTLLDNPQKAKSIGQAARKTVEKDFSWEKSARKLEKIIYDYCKN